MGRMTGVIASVAAIKGTPTRLQPVRYYAQASRMLILLALLLHRPRIKTRIWKFSIMCSLTEHQVFWAHSLADHKLTDNVMWIRQS
ncbi:MAG TPA: hypothetical protein DCE56_36275 [Cyanobacteria bacterium UBA8553]|nr:hypothetical protein [Cyanobacteria bacterium UBA8553]HAJ59939.1 hypothetical protein [Cyanobacteria bacterium UBA8543]